MDHSSAPLLHLSLGLAALFGAACSAPGEGASSLQSDGIQSKSGRAVNLRAEAPRLAADVYWLADDARYGRRSGSPGEDAARDYLVERLTALGIRPAGESGYTQAFDVPMPARDGGATRLSWLSAAGARTHVAGNSVNPLFCSDGTGAEGELVFAGFGIVDPELGRDDYSALDVDGKIVLIARGTPPFPKQEEQPEGDGESSGYSMGPRTSWGNAASLFTKAMNAKHRGAVAVIIGQDPLRAGEAILSFDVGRAAQASMPVVMVDVEVAESLLGGGGYADGLTSLRAGGAMEFSMTTVSVRVDADVRRETGVADNVLGLLRGADSSRYVVVGAHYDHLGTGGSGSLDPDSSAVHNGADDNASGTAAVLELARLMAAGERPACDVIFALWSGEELGLLGSEHWNKNVTHPGQLLANVNMDMVGRAESGRLQVMGAGTSEAFPSWLPEAASRADLDPIVTLSGHGIGGSDHQSFIKRGIPALHLFTGVHTDYHKPSDDADKFEADGARRIVEYARFLIGKMTSAEQLPFTEVVLAEDDDRPQRERSWSVWFGSIPDYAGEGGGLLLSGVQENSPASRAGLLGGDVILQLGDIEVDTIHDFVHALQVYQPGNVLPCRIDRRGAEQTLTITLGTRAVE
jgi:aminopeptidase YwaD